MISCRAVRADDAPDLARLHAACFARGWSGREIADLLAGQGVAALVARAEDGSALGFALARAAADEAEILTVAVAPDARRKGIARTLVQRLMDTLARAGVRALFLEVASGNGAARALYAGLGFAEAGRRKDYYGAASGREDALLLRAALPAVAPDGNGFHATEKTV